MAQNNLILKSTQLPLFYDTPLAKSVPSRPLDKSEVFIIVNIQQAIQQAVSQDENIDSSKFVIIINPANIAKVRNKRINDVKKQCHKAVESLAKNFYTQTIYKMHNNQPSIVGAFSMYSAIKENADGSIHVHVGQEYFNYYRDFVAKAPDLQISSSFYLHIKSQYSYNLVNWLTATIYELRRDFNQYDIKYSIHVSYENITRLVPSVTELKKANYKARILNIAMNDINANPFSPLFIENIRIVHPENDRRATIGYIFDIEIRPTKEEPVFLSKPDMKSLVNGLWKWEIIQMYLERFNCDHAFITYIKNRLDAAQQHEQIIKSILKVIPLPKEKQRGAYIHKVFDSTIKESIYELAILIYNYRPELRDKYIDAIVENKKLKEKPIPEVKVEKPYEIGEFGKELLRRYKK